MIWDILLFVIVGFAGISATVAKVSFATVILVLVAFAEAGLIILGLIIVQNGQEASVGKLETVVPSVTTMKEV